MYDGVPFSGKLVKLRLKSNALSYGPIPEQDTEIEQKLEVSVKKKTARLSCYNFGNGTKYLLNQVYVRRESEKDIRDILAMFEAAFSAYEPTGFVCDGGSWELVLTNDKKERFPTTRGRSAWISAGRERAYPTACARYSTGPTSGRLRLLWRKKPMRAARTMARIR